MISKGNGLAFGPRRIGAGGGDSLVRRVPDVQVREDPFDALGIVNECDDALLIATIRRFSIHILYSVHIQHGKMPDPPKGGADSSESSLRLISHGRSSEGPQNPLVADVSTAKS